MVASPSPAPSPPELHNNRNETNKISATPLHLRMKKKPNLSHKKTVIETGKTKSKRKLFSLTIAGRDCTLGHFFDPLHSTDYDGLNESVSIPKWIPMIFTVPVAMVLDDLQSLVAAYIFGVNKDTIQHGGVNQDSVGRKSISGDRITLKTLVPNQMVDQEVLNLLATMLTDKTRRNAGFIDNWYLPTTFVLLEEGPGARASPLFGGEGQHFWPVYPLWANPSRPVFGGPKAGRA
ncbi:hypothetical protein Fmac_014197 [Flemingia macrophylla]|uniref:Uncharacterized protein n=1 Tax=Flemingia macrophylla TaxID=520843 RepID=A0ABD1MB31_9FABA